MHPTSLDPTPAQPRASRATTPWHRLLLALVATSALTGLPAAPAWADGRARMPADAPPAYARECGSCHLAFSPGLLPAASWERLMRGLDRHFGTDASLDAATQASLAAWLQRQAATDRRGREAPPEDRITRAAWFERKHRHLDAAAWRHPAVQRASNCAACHTDAARGDFDDDRLKSVPGLDLRRGRH